MEHAQAQAQLHTFRHQDALVVQACISKAQSEKNEAMHQLEAVVKHERTKITVRCGASRWHGTLITGKGVGWG
jgi:hypothetical protein